MCGSAASHVVCQQHGFGLCSQDGEELGAQEQLAADGSSLTFEKPGGRTSPLVPSAVLLAGWQPEKHRHTQMPMLELAPPAWHALLGVGKVTESVFTLTLLLALGAS